MTEQDLLVVRRFFDELWSQGQLNVADELLAAHHVHHVSGEDMTGPEEVKEFVTYMRVAFPDLRFTIEDEVVAADKVVVRWTAQGTHRGEFMAIPPTGRVVTWTGIDIVRLQDHRIVELWGNNDALGLHDQLSS